VKTGYGGGDARFQVEPDFVCDDVLTAVQRIIAATILR
jgi:hypothetical protein